MLPTERRRLVEKLVRELIRTEQHTIEHVPLEARRFGDSPPTQALRDVAQHARTMRDRLDEMLDAHELGSARGRLGAALASLRMRVVDRCIAGEHAYRTALQELRHAVDVVVLLRQAARVELLFGLIRWCDDWLGARRTLVSRVEAQLGWFARDPEVRTPVTPPLTTKPHPGEPWNT
jgi:hypothetical protein